MKAIEQYFHVVLFIMLYKVALTFKSVETPLRNQLHYCFHSTQRGTKIRRGLVNVSTLNPKCVTVGELYGEVNPTTMEWKDGLLSHIYRKYAKTSRGTIQGARRKQSNTPLPASPSRLSRASSAKSVVTSVSGISMEDSNERENSYGLFVLCRI